MTEETLIAIQHNNRYVDGSELMYGQNLDDLPMSSIMLIKHANPLPLPPRSHMICDVGLEEAGY